MDRRTIAAAAVSAAFAGAALAQPAAYPTRTVIEEWLRWHSRR